MRKIQIDSGTVEVHGRRAVVRVRGRYIGTVVKRPGGCWAARGTRTLYRSPADAAEALTGATAYGQAA